MHHLNDLRRKVIFETSKATKPQEKKRKKTQETQEAKETKENLDKAMTNLPSEGINYRRLLARGQSVGKAGKTSGDGQH